MNDRDLVAATRWTGEPDRDRVHHCHGEPASERATRLGQAEIDLPDRIVAGSRIDVSFRIRIGDDGLPADAGLRIAWRWPFDWEGPQTDDATAPGHLTCSAPVALATQFQRHGGLNPWQHQIDLRPADALSTGDLVEVTISNWGAPSFSTEDGYFVVLTSADGGRDWDRLVDPPRFTIEPGPATRLIAITPGDAVVGEPTTVRVRAVDAWENATAVDRPSLRADGVNVGTGTLDDRYPVWSVPVTFETPGVARLHCRAGELASTSNPTRVSAGAPARRIFWGDLHGGQSEIGCGAGTLDHHYAYAARVAGLQFTSQQANDHYITADLWQHVRDVTPQHDTEHFLAFLGCEWSPYTEDGGDRNVIYMTDEPHLHRSGRFFEEEIPDPTPDLLRAPEFLDAFRTRDVLLNLHVGGRPTNLDFHAPEIEPLFEVHSTHATSEWFLFDALSRGYRVGVTAGTDGVMGRPGACGPGRRVCRNVRNGLTAVSAPALTQHDVADAFRARRCYATTGARILLDVEVNGAPMGAESRADGAVNVRVDVEGTAPIERVDLFRGTERIATQEVAPRDARRLRLLCGGAAERGTAGAQRQMWEGTLRWDGGAIADVQPVGLQCPLDRVFVDDGAVRWETATAGNDMGFTFAAPADGGLRADTNLGHLEASLKVLRDEAARMDAGGLGRFVEFARAPATDAPLSAQLEFADPSPARGVQPYWIRVVQTDRERAWSSPVYVSV